MATNNSANTYIVPTTDNEVTQPSQPAFLASLNANDANVTGAGAVYLVGTNVALTEIFDQNADFNTNGTFTAPVNGRYTFHCQVRFIALTAASTRGEIILVTSNRSFYCETANSGAMRANSNDLGMGQSFLMDMDAADTATMRAADNGEVGDIVGIQGSNSTFFAGNLEC